MIIDQPTTRCQQGTDAVVLFGKICVWEDKNYFSLFSLDTKWTLAEATTKQKKMEQIRIRTLRIFNVGKLSQLEK